MPLVKPIALAPKMKAALLDPATRTKAVGFLADAVRMYGGQHATVVELVQHTFAEAKQPVPTEAEVDGWLYATEGG